jgi:hypothetical protein
MIKPYVLRKKLACKIIVYTGYITVYTDDKKYLYSSYSKITRLTYKDALYDAKELQKTMEDR